jgi:nanoRNase/pAp phosphatase (c-di-AMP/oligoRNAs hydrolase)
MSMDTLTIMEHPFPKSTSVREKLKRLMEVVDQNDTLGILIDADPDSMASAMVLKRIFWRKAKKVLVFHINTIKRADNLSLIKLLKINQQHIRNLKRSEITKWAVVDSQPSHHEDFKTINFDIIIDHHPITESSKAQFMDIREQYGANSTIMTEYLKAARIRPSPGLASALFYGIKTDTDNFVRASLPNDINAFRYLYKYTNLNIIKKIESSEMTKKTLVSYRYAMERYILLKDMAYVHMDSVDNPDVLVIIADFFMRLAEVTWSFVSGIYADKVVIVARNAGVKGDAGKKVQKIFGGLGGSAGGHRSAARAEIPLSNILPKEKKPDELKNIIERILKKVA